MADMSISNDLKRYNYLDYITTTKEYSYTNHKEKKENHEKEFVINRFFTEIYLKMFLTDLLQGKIEPSLLSESEEIPIGIDNISGSKNRVRIVGSNFNKRCVIRRLIVI